MVLKPFQVWGAFGKLIILILLYLVIVSGHFKTGQLWSLQNQPL